MTKTFEEEFNYLIELSGKVLIGQVDAEKFEENRVAFFEKYNTGQQQTLPVVPEFVAKTLEILKKCPDSLWSKLYESLGEEGVTWLNNYQFKVERFGFGGLNHKLFVLFHLVINGYTVQKPQLFYLKNKLTRKYLRKSKHTKDDWNEEFDRVETVNNKTKFTQSEIDSMQIGSYEQIEVAE